MYIGSTDSRGLMHCLWEIIDNSVDEALAGVCTRVDVTLHPDGSAEVHDNGRGIPVDKEPKTGLSGVEVVFTKLHAGGKFGGGSYNATGGLHGVGSSVVNALSVPPRRRGRPLAGDPVDVVPPRRAGRLRRRGPRGAASSRSRACTRASGWPRRSPAPGSASGPTGRCSRRTPASCTTSWSRVPARPPSSCRASSSCCATCGAAEPVEESFRHDGGITEYCDFLSSGEPVTEVLRLQGSDHFTETVPLLDDKGHMIPQDVERELNVDVALRWGSGYDTEVRSYVNVIATPKGGTHVGGFESALTKTFNDVLRESKTLKVAEPDVVKDDALEGLTAVVTVRLAEPQFEGQTKEVLGTPAARSIVRKVVGKELKDFLTSTKRADKAQAKPLLEKIANASRTRLAARQQRDNQRRKNALESSALPAKLADCRSSDNDRTELFIVEGDSALGTAKLARNSEFQALLPIRGKILNVQKASVGDMLKNTECASIIQVVGAGSGRTFDLEQVRYGRIVFMADADSDGAHIRCLLATLFFKYMPELITSGRVFSAVPPLHRIELTNPKKGMGKYIYTYSDAELQRKLAELTKKGHALEGPGPALQGPRRDGRRPAGGDHDGPAAPDAAAHHRRRRRRRLRGLRAAHGQRGRAAQGVHRGRGLRDRRRAHRRLTRFGGQPVPQLRLGQGRARGVQLLVVDQQRGAGRRRSSPPSR